MADKLNSTFIQVSFVDGERPSAAKFSAITAQTLAHLKRLDSAVGDALDLSYPYTTVSSKRLSQPYGRINGSDATGADAKGRELNIASLARLVGPAGNLNPRYLDLARSINAESVPTGVYEFRLRYVPDAPSAVTFSDTTVFATYVAAPSSLTAAGEYHVDSDGLVYAYTVTAGGSASYTTTSTNYDGGSSYSNARFNRIPDQNQISAGGAGLTVTGPDAAGAYNCALPTITHQQSNYVGSQTALSDSQDYNYGLQLQLPKILTDSLSNGDSIPEGFLYLRNDSTGEVYEFAAYTYVDSNNFKISGVSLNLANTYSCFTVGTDITSMVDFLAKKLQTHTHNRKWGEEPIAVSDLTGQYKAAGASGSFNPSENASNYFPQYLHRDGFRAGVDNNNKNDANAMRGQLIVGRQFTDSADTTASTEGNYLGQNGSSFELALGNSVASGDAPYFKRQADGTLLIQSSTTAALTRKILLSAASSIDMTSAGFNGQFSGQTLWQVTGGADLDMTTNSGNASLRASAGKVWLSGKDCAAYIGQQSAGLPAFDFEKSLDTGSSNVGMRLRNSVASASSEGLQIDLRSDDDTPGTGNRWLAFRGYSSSGSNYTTRGGVRGGGVSTSPGFGAFSVEPNLGVTNQDAADVAGNILNLNASGDAQFFSGAGDFGEFVEAGDLSEWPEMFEDGQTLGIPEGWVVYLRNGKFYRTGSPEQQAMIVTHRALVVGNDSGEGRGEVLSFCGQVPVLVSGPCNDGDYLVPTGKHYCIAVRSSRIDFQDYRRALGRAWGEKQSEGISGVLCGIGVK